MGVFSSIRDAIFGKKAAEPAKPAAAPAQPTAMPQMDTPSDPNFGRTGAPTPLAQVDVEAVLSEKARTAGQDLNWRTSIVDLMKLLDLDSSLENRKELARELNYTGDMNDSATMNIWLHKQVMRELAENGGIVPAELKD